MTELLRNANRRRIMTGFPQTCLPTRDICAKIWGNENAPGGVGSTIRALTSHTKGTRVMANDLSYHTPFSVDSTSELQRIIGTARSWCADLSRIYYASPRDLFLLQRFYDISTQYVNILSVDDSNALQLAADAASDELLRRDKLCLGNHPPIKSGYVYLLRSGLGDYKIGCSMKPQNRLLTFGVLLPYPVELLCLIFTPDMYRTEQELQDRFHDKCIAGEWFKLDEADVAVIMEMAA